MSGRIRMYGSVWIALYALTGEARGRSPGGRIHLEHGSRQGDLAICRRMLEERQETLGIYSDVPMG